MKLKAKIDAEAHGKLSEELQKLYKADGDDFVLQIEGADDPAELRRARDREKQRAKEADDARKAAEKERDDLKAKLDDESSADARKKGDIDALEKSWRDKHEKAIADGKAEADKLRGQMRVLLVENKARALAEEISTAPDLILPHIMGRMSADFDGDTPVTRVLDVDGKPSAASLDELKKEIVATAKFAPIIRASSATGGGAGNSGGNGGGASEKKFGDLNERERTEFYNRDPQGFQKAADAHKAELDAAANKPK